jgi:hypothetical protein
MDLGLYFNSYLTQDPAWNPGGTNFPTYPRPGAWSDSLDKLSVCKASIQSMKQLPFKNIVLNISGDTHYSNAFNEILDCTKKTFPQAKITSSNSRPSSLGGWKTDLNRAKDVFGVNNPIVCAFNHDHIFVDHTPKPFIETLERVFSQPTPDPKYLYYSHAPELISIGHNPDASKIAFNDLAGIPEWFGPVDELEKFCFSTKSKGVIHGYFATDYHGLSFLWNSASVASPYVPRPDWPSISFPNVEFNCFFSSREFFRHFDGYGHISLLGNGLSLDLSQIDGISGNSPETHFSPQSEEARRELVDLYTTKFTEIYSLAFRNVIYSAWKSGNLFDGRKELEALLKRFEQNYLVLDAKHLGFNPEFIFCIRNSVNHRILSTATTLASQAVSDLILQKMNFSNRAFEKSESFISKFKRILINTCRNSHRMVSN